MQQTKTGKRLLSVVAILGIVGAMMVVALTANPAAAQDEDAGHPAHIHTGTCDTLGDIEYPLSNVGPGVIKNGKAQPAGTPVGATEDIYPVEESITTIHANLSDIADGNHALNVHESAKNIQVYIACGNIGGTPVNGDLVIGLEQRSNSGYTGVAVLHPRPVNNTVVVTVYLSEGLAGGGEEATAASGNAAATSAPALPTATAAAALPTATSEASAGATQAVTIQNFAFAPQSLQIAVGTTVTWTNKDSANHTVTADDGSFDSGQLSTGDTFSQTFTTAGTFTYHCSNHPNMTATIVVS